MFVLASASVWGGLIDCEQMRHRPAAAAMECIGSRQNIQIEIQENRRVAPRGSTTTKFRDVKNCQSCLRDSTFRQIRFEYQLRQIFYCNRISLFALTPPNTSDKPMTSLTTYY